MRIDDVLREYKQRGSINATAKTLNCSAGVVIKSLVTAGVYKTSLSEKIGNMHKQGKFAREIAEELGVSVSCVNIYLPYERGTYAGDSKTTAWRTRKASKED